MQLVSNDIRYIDEATGERGWKLLTLCDVLSNTCQIMGKMFDFKPRIGWPSHQALSR